MSEQNRTEEFSVNGDQVVEKVKQLIKEGNVRRVIIKNEKGEGAELQRQTRCLYDEFIRRELDTTLHEFDSQSGADAHCQLNNLRLPLEFSTFAFPHEKQRRTSDSLVVDNLCLFENFIDRRAEVARAELPSVFFQIDIGGFIDVPR